jgi:voltage-gated potassium channel
MDNGQGDGQVIPLERRQLRQQIVRIGAVVSLLVVGGTVGYYLLGHWLGRPDTLVDCLYMTVITLTTVGYGEIIPVAETPQGRLFSALLILFGVGTLFYALTSLAVITVEGVLHGAWRQWRMERRIASLKDHFIVCGCGKVGEVIVRELVLTKRPVVAVDSDRERLATLASQLDVPYVVGDATDEATLKAAGVERAAGLLAALPNDHENLFLVITAKSLNPRLRVVARGNDPSVVDKMKRVGADEVVLTPFIGGLRMVSVMVRPAAVSFLDTMLREREQVIRVEEVQIRDGSPLVGQRLADARLPQRWQLLVLAYRKGDEAFVYNPPADTLLESGMTLIVLGEAERLAQFRRLAAGTASEAMTQ